MSSSTAVGNSQAKEAQANITSWASKDGSFKRLPSSFRSNIEEGGQFPPELNNRYHFYVSDACPWAHRTMIVRKLKGLESHITINHVHPHMGALGWSFNPPIRGTEGEYPATKGETAEPGSDGVKGVTGDTLYGSKFVREIYFRAQKDYEGRFTVPILWDTKTETIVSNESSEIIRCLNTSFNHLLPAEFAKLDLYPDSLKAEIDAANEWIYNTVNNGVYKSGFATAQKPYEEAVTALFSSLDRIEKMLDGKKKFLIGNTLTEADVRLFTTIVRFDCCYHQHFKCNIRSIRHDYPNLNHWLKNLYHNDSAFSSTTSFEHIRMHYMTSHPQINPTRIMALGMLPNVEAL